MLKGVFLMTIRSQILDDLKRELENSIGQTDKVTLLVDLFMIFLGSDFPRKRLIINLGNEHPVSLVKWGLHVIGYEITAQLPNGKFSIRRLKN
jgi:hypothetical protein